MIMFQQSTVKLGKHQLAATLAYTKDAEKPARILESENKDIVKPQDFWQ